jgi:hypothetical protein
MKLRTNLIAGFLVLMAACSSSTPVATETAAPSTKTPVPSPTPFPMSEGLFTGAPQDFLLNADTLEGYTPQDIGFESDNARVIELREDGEEYIAATGRLSGWQIQFDRQGEDGGPAYVVQVVNTFGQANGPTLAIGPTWQAPVYAQFENGGLEQLSGVEGLEEQDYLMWRDANGSVGLQIVYRNLLLFYTGPYASDADPLFFAQLALRHIDWIQAGEP